MEPIYHACHRSGVDNVSPLAMGPHMRHKGTHAVDHSHQVDIQNPAPVVERAAPTPDAGVVAQDVDFADSRKGCFGSGVDGSGIGNIADNALYFRPEPERLASAASSAVFSISASITLQPASAKA